MKNLPLKALSRGERELNEEGTLPKEGRPDRKLIFC